MDPLVNKQQENLRPTPGMGEYFTPQSDPLAQPASQTIAQPAPQSVIQAATATTATTQQPSPAATAPVFEQTVPANSNPAKAHLKLPVIILAFTTIIASAIAVYVFSLYISAQNTVENLMVQIENKQTVILEQNEKLQEYEEKYTEDDTDETEAAPLEVDALDDSAEAQ